MQPSTTMMKIVAFLSCSVRYSTSFVILRIHKETLKPSSLPSQQLNFAQESLLPFVQISTNRFHLPKNGAKNIPETGINTNFRLEHSVRENRTTFSDVLLLPEIFRWNDPKSVFTFQLDFPET